MKKLNKLMLPAAAALVFAVAPAWADDSETKTRVEQRTETDGVLGTERSRSVETRTQHDDDDDDESTTTTRRDERLSAGGNTVEKRTEEKVEHDDD